MVLAIFLLASIAFIIADMISQRAQIRGGRLGLELRDDSSNLRRSLLPPADLMFYKGHSWAKVGSTGSCKIGIDGLVGQLIGRVDAIRLPAIGSRVTAGETIARIEQGGNILSIKSPVDGEIVAVNSGLQPKSLSSNPYDGGWLCEILPNSLEANTCQLVTGKDMEQWHRQELQRIADFTAGLPSMGGRIIYDSHTGTPVLNAVMEKAGSSDWQRFQQSFLEG